MIGIRDPMTWGGDPWLSEKAEAINRALVEPTDEIPTEDLTEWREELKRYRERWYERDTSASPLGREDDSRTPSGD